MSTHEIDLLFNELQLKRDINDYIQYNKQPKYLKKTLPNQRIRLLQLYPKMDEPDDERISYRNQNYRKSINHINETITKCDNIIKVMTLTLPEVETCPICICEFGDTNYVIPKCGHKVCAICFTNNLKYNKHTGDCCVLCRQKIC